MDSLACRGRAAPLARVDCSARDAGPFAANDALRADHPTSGAYPFGRHGPLAGESAFDGIALHAMIRVVWLALRLLDGAEHLIAAHRHRFQVGDAALCLMSCRPRCRNNE